MPLAEGFEEIRSDHRDRRTAPWRRQRYHCRFEPAPGERRAWRIAIEADTLLDTALQKDFDLIVLPVGCPAPPLARRRPRANLLQRAAQQGRYTAAICAAPGTSQRRPAQRAKRPPATPGIDKLKVPGTTLQKRRRGAGTARSSPPAARQRR